jgi:signal transducing adaptor molecule
MKADSRLYLLEKATSDKNVSEKWGMIMDICDKIGTSSLGAKESLKIIIKRLNHPDPHVVVQAITVILIRFCPESPLTFQFDLASRCVCQQLREELSSGDRFEGL